MPQLDRRIQIAQGGQGEGQSAGDKPAAAGTHAGAEQGEHHYKLGDIPEPQILVFHSLFVAILMVALGKWLKGKMTAIPRGQQSFGEFVVDSMIDFTRGIIGPGGEKYVPLVGTLFFFILIGNLISQVPYLMSPTSNLSTTLALGLIVFLYVQFIGIRSNGVAGYLKHFWGPFTTPRNPMFLIGFLLFPIEIISELVKPFTLAMRLFGNIFGEDTVIIVLSALAVTILPKAPILPLQFPILVLGLLTAFVQALVFSLLTCIYISLQSHHDSDHEGQGHSPGHGHPGIEESGLVP